MARDKRGRLPEPDVDEVMNDMAADERGDFVAGPTSRNEAGDTRRAAAKVTGVMGASKKIDPDLSVDPQGDRPKSGSRAGLHSFQEVPPEKGAEVRVTRSNAEIVDEANIAARKSPASRAARTEAPTGFIDSDRNDTRAGSDRQRVPAPGNRVSVPKGTLVRGHPTATQAGDRSQSSTGDEKPPKRSARAGAGQTRRPLAKGTGERD
jgi:hypothetical protein